jgi:hypothetical protein
MTPIRHMICAVALSMLGILGSACSENPVGRACFIGDEDTDPTLNVVASPALECQSRTCLHMANNETDLCTAECSSDDECDGVPETTCKTGFTCAVPVTVGPFCCKKMCICKDYIAVPEGGIPEPAACTDLPANECCNLPDRRGNSLYPQCT